MKKTILFLCMLVSGVASAVTNIATARVDDIQFTLTDDVSELCAADAHIGYLTEIYTNEVQAFCWTKRVVPVTTNGRVVKVPIIEMSIPDSDERRALPVSKFQFYQ
jgi:hypothetical protein